MQSLIWIHKKTSFGFRFISFAFFGGDALHSLNLSYADIFLLQCNFSIKYLLLNSQSYPSHSPGKEIDLNSELFVPIYHPYSHTSNGDIL